MRRAWKQASTVAIVVAACMMGSSPANAQNAVVDAYGGAGQAVSEVAAGTAGNGDFAGTRESGEPAAGRSAASATLPATTVVAQTGGNQLPFTGLDLALLIVGGLTLLTIGVGARWLSRPRAAGI